MKSIRLQEGKERSLLRRHPWVFQGSVDRGKADPGETVRVEASDGRFLAWAAFSPTSMIRVRAWSFDEAERIDHAFFKRRIDRALALRKRLPIASDGVRLIHGEADGLPGLIVDRYADALVAQFLSAGTERWKQAIADVLCEQTGCTRLYERVGRRRARARRPDSPSRAGCAARAIRWCRSANTAGNSRSTSPAATKPATTLISATTAQRFADWVRHFGCQRVLNAYCYTGGFSVAALDGGAERVVSVDSSAPALERVTRTCSSTALTSPAVRWCRPTSTPTCARRSNAARASTPSCSIHPSSRPPPSHAERAARAYKDINRLALKLLAPGGLLFTFSCSGGVSADLFHKIVAGAGIDAEVDGAIIERLHAAADHPTTICFPEGEYLKGLVILKQGLTVSPTTKESCDMNAPECFRPAAGQRRRMATACRPRRLLPAGGAVRLERPGVHAHQRAHPRPRAPLPDQPLRADVRRDHRVSRWSRSIRSATS